MLHLTPYSVTDTPTVSTQETDIACRGQVPVMADRERLVLNGPADLRSACAVFKIEQFQAEYSLLMPKCKGPIEILALMRQSRAEIHSALLDALVKRLETELIPRLTQSQLEGLLRKTFAFASHPELRPIVMAVLKRCHHVPEEYLSKLAGLTDVTVQLPLTVQQQVWQLPVGRELFTARLYPIMDQYCRQNGCPDEASLVIRFFKERANHDQRRATSTDLKDLRGMVGDTPALAEAVMDCIAQKFHHPVSSPHPSSWAILLHDFLVVVHNARLTHLSATPIQFTRRLQRFAQLALDIDAILQSNADPILEKLQSLQVHRRVRRTQSASPLILSAPGASA
jgi:hypothetical protein